MRTSCLPTGLPSASRTCRSSKAILNALLPKRNQKDVTSLIEEFQYPKYGPGMMWEVCRDKVEAAGSKVIMQTAVTTVHHRDGRAVRGDRRDRGRADDL